MRLMMGAGTWGCQWEVWKASSAVRFEVGIGEDRALPRVEGQIGLGTFQACVGLRMLRMSCKSLWVASF